ncbi:MAG: hypothetical protein KJN82_06170 [Bacteroidia bacterium]|nr:hypothetical protein [Bacteroidia bacterium]
MILDTTYFNKENKNLIEDIIGKPYSFLQALKMKGVGSKRLIIEEVSPNMQQYMNKVADINYANIELRPKGILIYINKGLRNFTWIIPYYQLVIYKTNGSSIHAQGKYIHFRNNINFKENKQFFKKLLNAKVDYDQTYHALPY